MSDTAQREMTREELIAENATLRQERDALQSRIDKGMDYEHHTSCGHVWTIRHTACPECFTRAKADLALALAALRDSHANSVDRQLRAYPPPPHEALCRIAGEVANGVRRLRDDLKLSRANEEAVMVEVTDQREVLLYAQNARREAEAALAAERIENAHLREAFVTMEKAYNANEAALAALRDSHANIVHRLEAWARSNDEERQAGKVPTFLNPHTVLLWMEHRSSSDDSGTHGAVVGASSAPSSDATRVAPSGEGSGRYQQERQG